MIRKILLGISIVVITALCLMLLMTPTLAHAWNFGPNGQEWMALSQSEREIYISAYFVGAATAMERARVTVARCPDNGQAWKIPSGEIVTGITESLKEVSVREQSLVQIANVLDELLFKGCVFVRAGKPT